MRRLLVTALLAVALVSCSDDGSPTVGPSPEGTTESSATAPAGGGSITVALTAAAVVGGGDQDGSGTAVIRLVPERAEVCYTLTVHDIDPATQAHIHRGAVGVAGPVVLGLSAPDRNGTATSCAAGDSLLLEELASSPSQFYVQVHNETFPNGALRGQLG